MVEASLQPLCKGFAFTSSQPGKCFSNCFLQKTLSFSTLFFQQLQQKAFKIGDQNIWVCHQVLSGDRTASAFIAQSWHSLGFFALSHSWKKLNLIIRKKKPLFATECWNNRTCKGQWQQQGSSSKQQAASMRPKKILCFNAPYMFLSFLENGN